MERTLILVKPDAFARGLTGEVIARFERKGLRIVALKSWMRRSFAAARRRGDRRWLTRFAKLPGVTSMLTTWTARTGRADCMTILARKPAAAQRRECA